MVTRIPQKLNCGFFSQNRRATKIVKNYKDITQNTRQLVIYIKYSI